MNATTVTPIRTVAKRPASARKTKDVDASLLMSAANLIGLVAHVYDFADEDEIHQTVRTAHCQVEQWCSDNENADLSSQLFEAYGVLMLIDMALEARLQSASSTCDAIRSSLDAAKNLLRKAASKPTDD
jgi:hypothetical protein